jgi:hypothetical protein
MLRSTRGTAAYKLMLAAPRRWALWRHFSVVRHRRTGLLFGRRRGGVPLFFQRVHLLRRRVSDVVPWRQGPPSYQSAPALRPVETAILAVLG